MSCLHVKQSNNCCSLGSENNCNSRIWNRKYWLLFVCFFKNKTGEDFKNVSMHSFRNTITKTIKNFHSCIRWNVYTKKKKWKNNTNLKKKISHTGKWNKFISKSSQIKGCFWLFYYILTNGNIAYFHASTFVLNFVLNITFDFFF